MICSSYTQAPLRSVIGFGGKLERKVEAARLLLEAREGDVAVGERASGSCCALWYAIRRMVSTKNVPYSILWSLNGAIYFPRCSLLFVLPHFPLHVHGQS